MPPDAASFQQRRPHDWMAAQALGWGPPAGPRRPDRVSRRFRVLLALFVVVVVAWSLVPLVVPRSSGLAKSPVGPVFYCPLHTALGSR